MLPEIEALGPLRVLVNCAGVAPAGRMVGRDGPMPLASFERVVRVNLIGTLQHDAARRRGHGPPRAQADGERGVIVNTASVAAFEGQIGQTAYAASKGGVAALTLPAARELASQGIRVMAIAPGLFGTPMLLGMPERVQESLAATVPFPGRFGEPEEYADLVLHILPTRCSTAASSASTAPCAWRRDDVFGTAADRRRPRRTGRGDAQELPEPFRAAVAHVPILVTDWPDDATLDAMGIEDPLDLTGLYAAVPVGRARRAWQHRRASPR